MRSSVTQCVAAKQIAEAAAEVSQTAESQLQEYAGIQVFCGAVDELTQASRHAPTAALIRDTGQGFQAAARIQSPIPARGTCPASTQGPDRDRLNLLKQVAAEAIAQLQTLTTVA